MNSIEGIHNVENKEIAIVWNGENANIGDDAYCLRFIMVDGSFKYAYVRGKIHRMPKYEAEAAYKDFGRFLEEQKRSGDPLCYTSEDWRFGKRSFLERVKGEDETLIEIQAVELCKYSDFLGRIFNRCDHYYAPMCMVTNRDMQQIVILGNILPLLSDPFNVKNSLKTWSQFGVKYSDVSLSIIKNDNEFDDVMRSAFRDDLVPIIDPVFREDVKLSEGIVIRNFQDFEARAADRMTRPDRRADLE